MSKIIKFNNNSTINNIDNRYYSVKEVAEKLNSTPHYVYKLLDQKALKFTKLPTKKIHGSWLKEFIENSAFIDYSNPKNIKEVA